MPSQHCNPQIEVAVVVGWSREYKCCGADAGFVIFLQQLQSNLRTGCHQQRSNQSGQSRANWRRSAAADVVDGDEGANERRLQRASRVVVAVERVVVDGAGADVVIGRRQKTIGSS